MSDDN